MSTPNTNLFLYEHPYVLSGRAALDVSSKMLDYFDEFDRKDEDRLRDVFLKFILENNLAETNGDFLKITTETDRGSWLWHTTWMNMRALVIPESLNKLLQSLDALDGNPRNLIIDLHNRLGIMFHHRFLNTIVHRTISSTLMVFGDRDITENITTYDQQVDVWVQIHKDHPFLWVLIYCQYLIRTQIPLPKL